MTDTGHKPIMVEEVLGLLDPQQGETYVDLTLGRAGHARAIARRIGSTGTIIGFDLDAQNIQHAPSELETPGRPGAALAHCAPAHPGLELHHANYREAPRILTEHGVSADMILADLGFASSQMGDADRGFSFRLDGPLDMRFNRRQLLTAAQIVNEGSLDELTDIIRDYGEEPLCRKIARLIVAQRDDHPIQTTARLANIVITAYGSRAGRSRLHPATRVFMALRIAVNDELGSLEGFWSSVTRQLTRTARSAAGPASDARGRDQSGSELGGGWISPGCRIAILSFHSLEDRIVKRAMTGLSEAGCAQRLTRGPIRAGKAELAANPRARSAKLRAIRCRTEAATASD